MDNLKTGGAGNLDSDSKTLPSLKLDTSSEPRMLTPSEIAWLQDDKRRVLSVGKSLMEEAMMQRERIAA